jgi:hypothetical protein
MMGGVSVVLVRFRWTVYPSLVFLAYTFYRIAARARLPGGVVTDVLSPLLIATGLLLMHQGRRLSPPVGERHKDDDAAAAAVAVAASWTWMYWLGEACVIFMFSYNSATILPRTTLITSAIALFAILAALWFRGSFWNYLMVVAFEALLALMAALAFPMMELLLEAILNEKLRKVGDKVRAHHAVLERYYQSKKG